jgi:hypothetical protein
VIRRAVVVLVWTLATVLATVLVPTALASAEPVVPIRLNGPATNRVNLVVLGDGYAARDMLKYATDVDLLIIGLFRETPYSDYANYFNVYRIDVTSNESGVDHSETGVARDTALGAGYNCGGIQRLICVNTSLVNTVLSRSVPANQRDIVIVLVNDAEYGGSGGFVSVASTHPSVVELMLHEMGHTVGLLADEYTTQPPPCVTVEPPEANASRLSDRSVKWNYWIDAATPLPTTSTTEAVPGTYMGSKYCPTQLFRPTFNSKMNGLGRPFEQINTEQLIKRFYNFAAPIDIAAPSASSITPAANEAIDFSVATQRPAVHSLSVRWTLDGAVVGQETSYRLFTSGMTVGSHTVVGDVFDPNPAVRSDPGSVLHERRTWTVNITQATSLLEGVLLRWRTR